jgi:hypothetical protein
MDQETALQVFNTHMYDGESINELLGYLSGDDLIELDELLADVVIPAWSALPGPQTNALLNLADETFYGGAAGGGKTDLLLGAALTEHWDSIIFRREFQQLKAIRKRASEIYVGLGKFNGGDLTWRFTSGEYQGKTIELGACQYDGDEQKYQGRPHDLKGFDEITHFTEAQYRFLKGWNRSTRIDPRTGQPQRCRVIAAGNPPINAEGQWVNRYWGAWLNPLHANPAKPGELRWYVTDENGEDLEVPDSSPIEMTLAGVKQMVQPTSRTFIRAKVQDNPYLMNSGYVAILQALPEPLRSRMLSGNFDAGEADDEWQVIPSDWILQAQARWAPTYDEYIQKLRSSTDVAIEDSSLADQNGVDDQATGSNQNSLASVPPFIAAMAGSGADMSAILSDRQRQLNTDLVATFASRGKPTELPGAKDVGVDVSRGGRDKTVASERIGGWFAALKTIPGAQTPDGPTVVKWLIEQGYKEWRCKIDVVGVGSSPVDVGRLEGMDIIAMSGAEASHATDRSNTLGFANVRAEWTWTLREALDPTLGLNLALPPDPDLAADLASYRWTLSPRGITIEEKRKTKKRLGRSTDKGDAVINAWAQPNIMGQGFLSYYREQGRLLKEQTAEATDPNKVTGVSAWTS